MILICTGSRDWVDAPSLMLKLDRLTSELDRKKLWIYVGDCPTGADRFVREWCFLRYVPMKLFHAEWDAKGKAAGPIRNQEMVDAAKGEPGKKVCVAFRRGKRSPGTDDCVARARKSGIKIRLVRA
jgi:hypothetical protein